MTDEKVTDSGTGANGENQTDGCAFRDGVEPKKDKRTEQERGWFRPLYG